MVQLTLVTFIALVACAACVPASYENRDVQPTPEVNIILPPIIVEPEPEPEPLPIIPTSLALSSLWTIFGSLGVIPQGAWVYGLGPVTVGDAALDDISGLLNLWGLTGLPALGGNIPVLGGGPSVLGGGLPVFGGGIPLVNGGLPGIGLGGGLIGVGLLNVVASPYLVPVQIQPQPQPEPEIIIPDIIIPPIPEIQVEVPSY